jgi:hypothetical protein
VKLQLKGARFDTIEGIQKAVTDQLNKIPAEDFSNTMKKLETRANLCITLHYITLHLMDHILNKYKKKNNHLLYLVFIALVWERLDRTLYDEDSVLLGGNTVSLSM